MPTALKVAMGNPGKRRLNHHEPKPEGVATCPEFLSPAAKAEWARLEPELTRLGLLTGFDQSVFAGYCQAFADWRFLATAESVPGTRKSIYAQRADALRTMRQAASEFGLSPSSRTGIVCPTKLAEDDLDAFIRMKPKL